MFHWKTTLGLLALAMSSLSHAQGDGTTSPSPTDAGGEEPAAQPAPEEAKKNPRRPETYSDAISNVGNDGIIIFCYGPDWNKRSTRMVKKFWERPEVEKVTGDAQLLAAPIYQDPTPEQKEKADSITQGMPGVPFGICPTVMMLDTAGIMYANLSGMDNLGDESGNLALKNIQEKLEAYRKQKKLLAEAENLNGEQKALKLGEVADLPIKAPHDLVDLIRIADPSDKTGMVRRNEHSALQFLYKMMHTKDGFLSADFQPSLKAMTDECMKVINDKALRPEDRQAAYCLLIGQVRREEGGGKHMKDMFDACAKIDPNTVYGRLAASMSNVWNGAKPTISPEQLENAQKDKRDRDKKK